MKVFIDGENLRHRLVTSLLQDGIIRDSDDNFRVDVRKLITDALLKTGETPEQITYFTTRIKQPTFEIPEQLTRKITQIQESHRRWIAELTNQGVRVVKAGLLKAHKSSKCAHCGMRSMLLQEKGVDVRIATEMVMAAIHDDTKHIVLLSSDTDMIPALEVVRRAGTRVTYLCFAEEPNRALETATDQTVMYTRHDILNALIRTEAPRG